MNSRKLLRLTGYDYGQSGGYFITICTKERRQCLSLVVGADALIGPHVQLTDQGQIVERYIQTIPRIDKYVIMPNHVHMILFISQNGPMRASAPTQTLSDRIRSFKKLASQQIGTAIWQRSFFDHVIRCEEEYRRIWQYIDDNPAKWAEDEYYSAE